MREETNSLIVIFVVICLVLYLILAGLVFLLMHLSQNKQKKHLSDLERIKQNQHEEVLKSKLSIQDDAFRALSRELHDNVSQRLSMVKLHVSSIPSQIQHLQQRTKMATNSIAEVMNITRDMSKSMNPDYVMAKGLVAVLNKEVEIMRKSTTIRDLQFHYPDVIKDFTPQNELMIFRIIQESVNNAIKYSGGDKITVTLKKGPDMFYYLTVMDNGNGFDMNDPEITGMGLQTIKDRANILGAEMDMESNIGFGTILKLKIPY